MLPAIIGTLSSLGTAISAAAATVGGAVSSFMATVGPTIATTLEAIKPIAEAISRFATAFLQSLSILKPTETVEEMGERALQAAAQGVTLESSDNFDDYLEKLRSVELDPDVSQKRTSQERLLAGLALSTVGIERTFNAEHGSLNGLWLLPMTNPQYFTAERMQGLVAAVQLGGDVLAYLNKNLSGGDARSFEKSLESAMAQSPKTNAPAALYEALDASRECWMEISAQVKSIESRTGA